MHAYGATNRARVPQDLACIPGVERSTEFGMQSPDASAYPRAPTAEGENEISVALPSWFGSLT